MNALEYAQEYAQEYGVYKRGIIGGWRLHNDAKAGI
jgi:hypothetical protein